MSVGSPTAGTWSSSQWRPDNEFETDRHPVGGLPPTHARTGEGALSSLGLTPMESRVAVLLTEGKSLREVARGGVSQTTVYDTC